MEPMPTPAKSRSPWLTLVGALGAIYVINLVITLPRAAGHGFSPWRVLVPAPEAMIILVMVSSCQRVRPRWAKSVAGLLTTLCLFSGLLVAANQATLEFFYRKLDLYNDLLHIKALVDLVKTTGQGAEALGALTGGVAVLVGAFFAIRQALLWASRGPWPGGTRHWTGLAVAYGILPLTGIAPWLDYSAAPILIDQVETGLSMAGRERFFDATIKRLSDERNAAVGSGHLFSWLEGRDLAMFVIEAYGEVVFGRDDYHTPLAADVGEFEAKTAAAGFHMVSGLMRSPVYGGNSWIADSSFECGIQVPYQRLYDRLLTSELPCLARLLGRVGYETFALRPGTRRAWPEGNFFGFDRQFVLDEMGYDGPTFFWSPLPDQYVTVWYKTTALPAARKAPDRPLFSYFQLTSSHAPYNAVPTLVSDWQAMLESHGKLFWNVPVFEYGHTFRNVQLGQDGYIHAIRYDWQVITEYLTRLIERDTVAVVIGDHQPLPHLIGHRTYGVPVHVLAKDDAVLERFRRHGFQAGMRPAATDDQFELGDFLGWMLEDAASTAHH